MIGPYIDGISVISGAAIGITQCRKITSSLAGRLSDVFSLITLGLAISLTIKADSFLCATLAVIFGFVTGELLKFDCVVNNLAGYCKKIAPSSSRSNYSHDEFSKMFSTVLVLFCTGATGITGAMTEGLTGHCDLLIIKSIMDFFSSAIFSASLGGAVLMIAIPLFIIESIIYCSANYLSSVISGPVLHDFLACGGILLLGAGVNLSRLKHMPAISLTPALVYVVIFSHFYHLMFP